MYILVFINPKEVAPSSFRRSGALNISVHATARVVAMGINDHGSPTLRSRSCGEPSSGALVNDMKAKNLGFD